MAKPELGTKRLCGNCGAKFYDLSKDPIVCPKCHTVMELAAVTRGHGRSRWLPARPRAAAEEEVVVPETPDAEFVSLEEADAEAQGKKAAEGEAVEGAEDEIELEDEAIDDAAFIEEQEEGDEDVTDIIGDVEDEEEPELSPRVGCAGHLRQGACWSRRPGSVQLRQFRTRPSRHRVPRGAIAQLGERLNGIQEVGGSTPPGSTT